LMPFGDFCDHVARPVEDNDVYMIGNNLNTERPELAPLLDDLRAPHPYLNDERRGDRVLFWFGPAGTVTPLHHDTRNVLLCQVFGHKKVLVFPRFEVGLTSEMRDGVYSTRDLGSPAFDAIPECARALRREVILRPGEGLFIPIGSFHHVRSLAPSMSISFTNFPDENDFPWYRPGTVR
jgi:ribosomal protein L16 Arg81 hydroxylase